MISVFLPLLEEGAFGNAYEGCLLGTKGMLREGFVCTPHSKGIYFDHHERPDVVDDRTNRFIPAMQAIRPRLVRYTVGDVTKRVETTSPGQDSDAEPRLVLVAHDEMTAQSNDDTRVYWHPVGEHRLKKKGVGRGLHQSDFICSTVGWLKDASQTLEYGKNYEGYWNGELFVKQVCFPSQSQQSRH